MPKIDVLNCPVCGAPLDGKSSNCAYCGSLVAIRVDHQPLDEGAIDQALIQERMQEFRARLKTDPDDAAAHYGLGVAYFNLGLLTDAISEMRQAARLTPERPEIQTQLAVMLAEQGILGDREAEREAMQRVSSALSLRPNDPDAMLLKARLQADRGEWEAAYETLQPGLQAGNQEIADRAAALLMGRAAVSGAHGDWSEAMELWLKAKRVQPQAVVAPLVAFCREHQDVLMRPPKFASVVNPDKGLSPTLGGPKVITGVVMFVLFVLSMLLIQVKILETPAAIVFLSIFVAPFVVPRLVRRQRARAASPTYETVRRIQQNPAGFFNGNPSPDDAIAAAMYIAVEFMGLRIAQQYPQFAGKTPEEIRKMTNAKPTTAKRW